MCTACWDCVSQVLLKVQKASKKALAHIKDHLERSLRPIQATQMTPGAGPDKKDLKSFGLKIKILRLENYFPFKGPHNSLSLKTAVGPYLLVYVIVSLCTVGGVG